MEFLRAEKSLMRKNIIGSGNHGVIYSLNPIYVAKVYHNWVDISNSLEYEYSIMDRLYNEGRNVPFPVGILEFSLENSKLPGLGFVMQFIGGISGEKTKGLLRERVEFLYGEEVERCRSLGFHPVDVEVKNSLYVPSEDKIYLIDFRLWIALNQKLFVGKSL